mmetsp:Transcript_12368/g.22344  ORF Transcript_12368/g.22344 Transcript_12368/m.22344 type:complete len:169 (-) Transcript_12368:1056-1562(-)
MGTPGSHEGVDGGSGSARRMVSSAAPQQLSGVASDAAAAELMALKKGKDELENRLAKVEAQIFELETSYLEDTTHRGNIVRGWSGFATKKSEKIPNVSGTGARRGRIIKASERIFSGSSITSPSTPAAASELAKGSSGAISLRDGGDMHRKKRKAQSSDYNAVSRKRG